MPPTSVGDTSKLSKKDIDKFTYIMKKLSPFDLEKYKMKKNKQRLKTNVIDKLVCANKRGKIQRVIKK